MKRLISILALVATVLVCVSCSGTENVSIYSYESSSSNPHNNVVSIIESYDDDVIWWDYYAEYTSALPMPSFEMEAPVEVFVAGEMILTFKSIEEVQLNDLLDYIDTLEAYGFDNRIDFESNDIYYGKVYKDNTIAIEYTYRYGVILIDVFKPEYSLNTSIISED